MTARGVIFNESMNAIFLVSQGGCNWHIPGGWLDGFETLEDACSREIMEELGISVTVQGLLFVGEYNEASLVNRFNENVHKIEHYFLCTSRQLSSDDTVITWIDKDCDVPTSGKFFPIAELREFSSIPLDIIKKIDRYLAFKAVC